MKLEPGIYGMLCLIVGIAFGAVTHELPFWADFLIGVGLGSLTVAAGNLVRYRE